MFVVTKTYFRLFFLKVTRVKLFNFINSEILLKRLLHAICMKLLSNYYKKHFHMYMMS